MSRSLRGLSEFVVCESLGAVGVVAVEASGGVASGDAGAVAAAVVGAADAGGADAGATAGCPGPLARGVVDLAALPLAREDPPRRLAGTVFTAVSWLVTSAWLVVSAGGGDGGSGGS